MHLSHWVIIRLKQIIHIKCLAQFPAQHKQLLDIGY